MDIQLYITNWRVEKRKNRGLGGRKRTEAVEIRRPNSAEPAGVEWDLSLFLPWRAAELRSGLAQSLGVTGGSLQSPICH